MNVGQEQALDKEQKSYDSVSDRSFDDELMQDIDGGNCEKARNMNFAPVTVDDMLKFLSEDLRTDI